MRSGAAEVLTCGTNGLSQLGLESTGPRDRQPTPTPVKLPSSTGTRVLQVSTGRAHTLALMDDGSVVAWGWNCPMGRILIGHTAVPSALGGLRATRIAAVSAGSEHSMMLSVDGHVLTCGCGFEGKLGHGDGAFVSVPKVVQILRRTHTIVGIEAGTRCSFAWSHDGALFSWGHARGAALLGYDVSSDHVSTPRRVTTNGIDRAAVTKLSAKGQHVLAADRAGHVWSWGMNDCGQLGVNTIDRVHSASVQRLAHCFFDHRTIIDVQANGCISLAMTGCGHLYSWGRRVVWSEQRSRFVSRPFAHPVPADYFVQRSVKVVGISAGFDHSIVVCSDGSVHTFGSNHSGQLGHGDFHEHHTIASVVTLMFLYDSDDDQARDATDDSVPEERATKRPRLG